MWPNPQFPADLVTFTEETLDGKLHFFAVYNANRWTLMSELDDAEGSFSSLNY